MMSTKLTESAVSTLERSEPSVKERGIGTDLDGYDLEIAASEW